MLDTNIFRQLNGKIDQIGGKKIVTIRLKTYYLFALYAQK